MIAEKYNIKTKKNVYVAIEPENAYEYMLKGYILLDDNKNLLDDPLGYAKEQIEKQQTIEIPIPDINAIKQIQADVQYIAMCSDVDL